MALFIELERAGIPVPHVYGWIDGVDAYVMERIPGQSDFAGSSETDKRNAIDDWLRIMAMMHRLDVEPFAQAGITARPARPNRDGSDSSSSNCLSGHQESSRPFAEFVLRWLRRNPLANDDREAVITWDSGQFHQQDGKIVGLLDVEIGHIGDPMMDLAALPGRDTYLDYGNLRALCARYEELGGFAVDLDAVDYYAIGFMLIDQLSFHWARNNPTPSRRSNR
jgi:aminoglycoside phosphotransferase (APT) family kinase protein